MAWQWIKLIMIFSMENKKNNYDDKFWYTYEEIDKWSNKKRATLVYVCYIFGHSVFFFLYFFFFLGKFPVYLRWNQWRS